jgi:hypothetical protein
MSLKSANDLPCGNVPQSQVGIPYAQCSLRARNQRQIQRF